MTECRARPANYGPSGTPTAVSADATPDPPVAASPNGVRAADTTARWELLRALGALVLDEPGQVAELAAALSLPPWSAAEHTGLFVLSLSPHASIYLGPDGMLGGEGADRIAGMWRALELVPPADADHLGAVLALYAEVGEAAEQAHTPAARRRLDHARAAVLWEHLWPWAPVYLDAVRREAPALVAWTDLLTDALDREARLTRPPTTLPLALRSAPAVLDAEVDYPDLLTAATTPIRTGFILSTGDLAAAARDLGLGLRRGERRFALRALLEQDAAATFDWLAGHARRAALGHQQRADRPDRPAHSADRWWAERAGRSVAALTMLASAARRVTRGPGTRR